MKICCCNYCNKKLNGQWLGREYIQDFCKRERVNKRTLGAWILPADSQQTRYDILRRAN